MINLMKHTYLMNPKKVNDELNKFWNRYQEIIAKENPAWDEINEARSILFLTGQVYCEKIAVEAIERRIHLLKTKLSMIEFLNLIDKNSEKLEELRKDELFSALEEFYRIVKSYKNKNLNGKYYLEEERFLKVYEKVNPNKELKMGYKGSFK